MPELYMSFGVKNVDKLQRGIASTLSKMLPSPKYVFKFSDTTYIVILISEKWDNAIRLVERLTQVFKAPFFIHGQAMELNAELGVSSFPDNGENLSQLIGASLSRTTLKASFKNITSS